MDKNPLTGHFRFQPKTNELFIIGIAGEVPILTLEKTPGGPLAIDTAAKENSHNLITSGAVFRALADLTESGGSFTTDATLTLKDGVLRVNTASKVEADNTLPVTSAAVNVTVGNIEALLETI